MTYKEIVERVSQENDIPYDIVDRTYKAYWKYIKDYIQSLPLKDNLSEEEFNKLRTSVNIPSLGKLTCTYQRWLGVKQRFNYINSFRKRNENS